MRAGLSSRGVLLRAEAAEQGADQEHDAQRDAGLTAQREVYVRGLGLHHPGGDALQNAARYGAAHGQGEGQDAEAQQLSRPRAG